MTIYLATEETNALTLAFCSRFCRSTRLGPLSPTWTKRDADAYEFDEKCITCGKVVSAEVPFGVHVVKVFKIGYCYLPVCSCGVRGEFLFAKRTDAAWSAIRHIEATGSMEEDDLWVSGTETNCGSEWDTPKLRLTIEGRNLIHVHTRTAVVTETIRELVNA